MEESCCGGADEACLPHVASLMYFRSPPRSRRSSPSREAMTAPTPRKMAEVGGVTHDKSHRRRCSSIPRPTSKLAAGRTAAARTTAEILGGNRTATMTMSQSIVKPRTYSRTRGNSNVANQSYIPSSFKNPRAKSPRRSLPATTSQHTDQPNDLSGIRQQLPLSRYSRHSLASLDAIVSSATAKEANRTAALLPLSTLVTKPNTSSAATKVTSPVIPQRQLMGPLGPPILRSQTMGNLSCFASAVADTPSPSKGTPRTISTASSRSKVAVVDALAESRMTAKEIEHFNQVAREVEANRQRIERRNVSLRLLPRSDDPFLQSSKTLTSFQMSNNSSEQPENDWGHMTIVGSSKRHPFHGAKIKIVPRSSLPISPTVLTPDSGVSMGTSSTEGWEINHKMVSEPLHMKRTT
jgi:hypothetical protein